MNARQMIVQQEESARVEYAPGLGSDIGKPRIFSVRDTYLAAAEQVIERVIEERDDALTRLRIEKECRAGNKYAVVDTVGGWVEGQPTTEFNYLQRLRELVNIELELKTVYAKLEGMKKMEAAVRERAKMYTGGLFVHFQECEYSQDIGGCTCGADLLNAVLQPNISVERP